MGKKCRHPTRYTVRRITPTRVGKSYIKFYTHMWCEGLPPLAWRRVDKELRRLKPLGITPTRVGKRGIFGQILGITPTRVGKSFSHLRRTSAREDYPHSRGEESDDMEALAMCPGLPPLAWGRIQGDDGAFHDDGITPTRVGKRVKKSHRYCIFLIFCIMFCLVCEVIS